jgi:hypothetical protein
MPETAGKKPRFGIKRPGYSERSGPTILAGFREPRLLAQAPRQSSPATPKSRGFPQQSCHRCEPMTGIQGMLTLFGTGVGRGPGGCRNPGPHAVLVCPRGTLLIWRTRNVSWAMILTKINGHPFQENGPGWFRPESRKMMRPTAGSRQRANED